MRLTASSFSLSLLLLTGCAPADFFTGNAGMGSLIGGGLGSTIGAIAGSRHGMDQKKLAFAGGALGAGLGLVSGAMVNHAEVVNTPPQRAIRMPTSGGALRTEQTKIDALHDSIKEETKWQPNYPGTLNQPSGLVRGIEEEDDYVQPYQGPDR